MSYDYDYLIIDWDNDTFIIVTGMNEYEYSISEHADLLEGGLSNGVPYTESGITENEDFEEYGEGDFEEYGGDEEEY